MTKCLVPYACIQQQTPDYQFRLEVSNGIDLTTVSFTGVKEGENAMTSSAIEVVTRRDDPGPAVRLGGCLAWQTVWSCRAPSFLQQLKAVSLALNNSSSSTPSKAVKYRPKIENRPCPTTTAGWSCKISEEKLPALP